MKSIREATPRRSTTSPWPIKVNQLVGASEADPDLGFMGRTLALCSLPRSNPGNRHQYKRVNGPYKLILSRTGEYKLPFGNLPRLFAWLCTEAVRTQNRELVLGSSLSKFMRTLDVLSSDSGGTTGVRTRLRNQMDRLFNAHVRLIYQDEHGEQFVSSAIADRGEFWWNPQRPDEPMLWESKIEQMDRLFHSHVQLIYEDEQHKASVNSQVADRTDLWWNPKRPDEPSLWDSKILLSEAFFNEIVSHPVPLDMNTLKALKRCALGLDLYLWLTYRTFALKRPQQLTWRHLYRQFGTDPAKASDKFIVRNFRQNVLRELKKIKLAWPGLNYTTAPGVLVLHPSTPTIAPVGQAQLV